jgi:hypothetical protein
MPYPKYPARENASRIGNTPTHRAQPVSLADREPTINPLLALHVLCKHQEDSFA